MFLKETLLFTVAVPPAYTNGCELLAAEEVLDSQLLKYSSTLSGILVSYDKLQFETPYGIYQDEQPDVLYRFKCHILLFTCKVGEELRATVSDIQVGHVTLLACGVFPVYVQKSGFPKNVELDKSGVSTGRKRSLINKKTNELVVSEGEEYYVKCLRVSTESGLLQIEATFKVDSE